MKPLFILLLIIMTIQFKPRSSGAISSKIAKEMHNRKRYAPLPPSNIPYTVIDSAADVAILGQGWTPIRVHETSYTISDKRYPEVDAIATFVTTIGQRRRVYTLLVHRAAFIRENNESLIPPDQMRWHGISVDAVSMQWDGRQEIWGSDFSIPLCHNGRTTFFQHVQTKSCDKVLPRVTLTGTSPYKPLDYALNSAVQNAIDPVQDPHDNGPSSTFQGRDSHKELFTLKGSKMDDVSYNFTPVRVRRRFLWDSSEYNWKPYQLAEWKKRLCYTSDEAVKKTFAATTQMVPSLKHENEQFPKDCHVTRFPFMNVRRLKESVYCDPVELPLGPNDKIKQYALMFYGGKSKIKAIYHLGKDLSATRILGHMYEFVRDFGAPTTFASDFANNLAKSSAWVRFCRVSFTKIHASEAGKHESNSVERAWQDVQKRGMHIMRTQGPPKNHIYAMFNHICDVHNHTALSSLGWRTPMELLSGDTPDLSVFRYYFWEQVWFKAITGVSEKQIKWVKGRFLGVAWTTGDNLCYRVVPEDGYARTVHRTIVLPRDPNENAPREILTQPSDYFFPTPRNTVTFSPQTVGRKRNRDDQIQDDETVVIGDDDNTVETVTNETDEVPAKGTSPLYNAKGPKEEKLRKEYLSQAKEFDKILSELSVPLVDMMDTDDVRKILRHYWKQKGVGEKQLCFTVEMANGETMKGVGEDDLKIDAPVTFSRYIQASKALLKVPRLKSYSASMIKTSEKILRLTRDRERTLGISSQSIQDAGQVSSRRRATQVTPRRSKKVSRNNRKSNPMGRFKYGVYVPRNVEEALKVDADNNDSLWRDSLIKEVTTLLSMKTFKTLTKAESAQVKEDYQFAPLRTIFDVKENGRRKSRIVAGGHVLSAEGYEVYASNMKTISARILMLIASANKFKVLTGDIKCAYLFAKTSQKVYVRLGKEFSLVDPSIQPGTLATIEQALYGLQSSGNRWHAHLADTLRSIGFKSTRFDPDVWMRPNGDHYDYLGTHTDDLLVVSKDPMKIMDSIQKTYTVSKIEEPRYHLGCDYRKNADGTWDIGTKTYVEEALKRVKAIVGKEDKDGNDILGKESIPMRAKAKPELDASELCGIEQHRKYQQLVGIAQWLITCGRMDLSFAVSSLSRFSHAPRFGHFKMVEHMFKYLNNHPDKWIHMDPSDHKPFGILTDPTDINSPEWQEYYPDATEELDIKFPEPKKMVPLTSAVYFDSDWAHDEKTRRSISGVACFVGNCPIMTLSRRQGAIATSTYSAELMAGRVGAEEAVSIRYMLRSLGVPVKGKTLLIGDNMSSLISSTSPGSECKKRAVSIAFHYVRECNAAGICSVKKIPTEQNVSDFFTKALDGNVFWSHMKRLFA